MRRARRHARPRALADAAADAGDARARASAYAARLAPTRVCQRPVLEGCGFATDANDYCYHYAVRRARLRGRGRRRGRRRRAARPLACDEPLAAPLVADANAAAGDDMRGCARAPAPTPSPTPLPTVTDLPTPLPSVAPTPAPSPLPTPRPTNYHTIAIGPFLPARDTTVRVGSPAVLNPANTWMQLKKQDNDDNYVGLAQWDAAQFTDPLAAQRVTPARVLDVATLTIDAKLNAINNTLSVHQLADDFPSCCWVANDNKNISGTTFDDLGGVDPFSDAPLATWEASPPSAAFAWNRIELNVTLDAATRAALLATDSPRGRFGFVLSDTQDGWAYLGTRDSRSGEISVTLYYEVVARSLERNWPAPTATPSISQAPTTRVTLTYQSRSDALSTDLSSLSDALSRWEALEAEPPTAGFCDVALQSAWKLNNPYVCADGAENDVAQKVTASFTVNAHRAGTWRIVQKFDWSHGGAYCMDGACTFIARGDNSYFHGRDVSLDTGWFFEWVGELAEGHHTFVSMGWERCCSTTAQLIVVDLPAPIRDGIPSTEWRNLTVDLLDEVYYSPSPTTPGPTAAFTPSPLPTPIPTLTNVMMYQSRSTRDWGWTTADRPEVPSFWLAPSNMNETIAAWAKVAAYDASVSTSTRSGRYCDLQLTSMWNLRNQYLCTTPEADGSQNMVASRVFAGFTVPANMSGTWEFEIAFDYSYGGFYCIDDDCTFITGLNTVVSICEISAGYHTYEGVGFERCCIN